MGDLIPNPLPKSIEFGGVTVELTEYAQLPEGPGQFFRNTTNFTYHSGDETGRMYAAESDGGRVWIVEVDGSVGETPFLNLKEIYGEGLVDDTKPTGLRSFAFHPEFHEEGAPGEGKFYTMAVMSVDSAQEGVETQEGPFEAIFYSTLTEWTVDPENPDRIDPDSAREILRIAEPQFNHNSEQLMFDPNAKPGDADYGMLYVATGDGVLNVPGDPFFEVQALDNARGKILRLDPLEQENGDAYGVPDDNPFLNDPNALPYIWAIGTRHLENLVFDTGGEGRMIFTDIGQKRAEEVNIGVAGANYGWPLREGTFSQSEDGLSHPVNNEVYTLPENDAELGFTYPVAQYGREEGTDLFGANVAAIVGGYVYRDDDAPDLYGAYIFGDIINGRVFYVAEEDLVLGQQAEIKELKLLMDGEEVTLEDLVFQDENAQRVDLRFAQNSDGEVFITSKQNGKIYKLNPIDDGGVGETIRGTADDDTIVGTIYDDKITALGGDDLIIAAAGDDVIDWHDLQTTRDGSDLIDGGDGADTARFFLDNGLGDIVQLGVEDGDAVLSRINLSPFTVEMSDVETIVIQGKAGADRLVVDNIEDAGVTLVDFRGSDGNDELRNRGGTDVDFFANGGGGDDFLNGAHGDDILIGGDGQDILFGRDGEDRLIGQKGDDILTGGGKRDVFVFAAGDGTDIVQDFQNGLDVLRFNGGLTADDLTFADVGAHQRIELASGDSILLIGLAGVELGAEDLSFG